MSCALTQGYSAECSRGVGGVAEVYIIEIGNITATTDTAGVITALTKAAGKRFWKYAQVRETSFAKETANGNEQNGTLFFQQEVQLVINRMNTAVRNEIKLLALNRLVFVVKDNNGVFWLYGQNFGLQLTGGETGTGTAMTDRNGYVLNFTGGEKEPAIEVASGVAAALETPGS